MEINPTARLRRMEPLNRPKAPAPGTPLSRTAPSTDRLSLSRQAAVFLEEHNRKTQEALARRMAERSGEDAEDGGEAYALAKELKRMKKCQQIAARIMSGGKVPPEDERYLMENDPDSYKLAMAARVPQKKPKKWDSVLDKEDRQGAASSGSGEASPAAGEAAPVDEGAGEACG